MPRKAINAGFGELEDGFGKRVKCIEGEGVINDISNASERDTGYNFTELETFGGEKERWIYGGKIMDVRSDVSNSTSDLLELNLNGEYQGSENLDGKTVEVKIHVDDGEAEISFLKLIGITQFNMFLFEVLRIYNELNFPLVIRQIGGKCRIEAVLGIRGIDSMVIAEWDSSGDKNKDMENSSKYIEYIKALFIKLFEKKGVTFSSDDVRAYYSGDRIISREGFGVTPMTNGAPIINDIHGILGFINLNISKPKKS